MMIVGILLILVSVAAGAVMITHTGAHGQSVNLFSLDSHSTVFGSTTVLMIGVVLGVALCLGLLFAEVGARHYRVRRGRLRAERRQAASAAKERDVLAARLEREQARAAAAEEVASTPAEEPDAESEATGRRSLWPSRT